MRTRLQSGWGQGAGLATQRRQESAGERAARHLRGSPAPAKPPSCAVGLSQRPRREGRLQDLAETIWWPVVWMQLPGLTPRWWAPGPDQSRRLWPALVPLAAQWLGRRPRWHWAFGPTVASLPWQGDHRTATPWLPALLQPMSPWGGHPAGGEVCGKEPIPLLSASAPALPVCMARLSGALATGLTHTHRLLPSWVDLKEPAPPLPWVCCSPTPRSHACQRGLATTGPLSWERAGWEMGPRDLAQKQVRVRGSQREAKKVRQHESKGKWGPHPCVSPQAP